MATMDPESIEKMLAGAMRDGFLNPMPHQRLYEKYLHSHAADALTYGMASADPLVWSEQELKNLIDQRMRWNKVKRPEAFEHIHCFKPKNSSKVHVYAYVNGESVTLTDDVDLFPSDGFITQLRLLGG